MAQEQAKYRPSDAEMEEAAYYGTRGMVHEPQPLRRAYWIEEYEYTYEGQPQFNPIAGPFGSYQAAARCRCQLRRDDCHGPFRIVTSEPGAMPNLDTTRFLQLLS